MANSPTNARGCRAAPRAAFVPLRHIRRVVTLVEKSQKWLLIHWGRHCHGSTRGGAPGHPLQPAPQGPAVASRARGLGEEAGACVGRVGAARGQQPKLPLGLAMTDTCFSCSSFCIISLRGDVIVSRDCACASAAGKGTRMPLKRGGSPVCVPRSSAGKKLPSWWCRARARAPLRGGAAAAAHFLRHMITVKGGLAASASLGASPCSLADAPLPSLPALACSVCARCADL